MQRHADNPPIRIYFLMNRLLDSNFTLHNSAYIINPQFNSLLNYLTFSNNLVFVHFERNEATGEDRAIIFPEIKGIPRASLKFWMHSVALRLRYQLCHVTKWATSCLLFVSFQARHAEYTHRHEP